MLANSVFVIHALRGYDYHEKRIRKLFGEMNISHEFITEGDPSNFTTELLGLYFAPNVRDYMSIGIISCTLNHFYAFERIVERKLPFGLVFENDPFFLGNFRQQLELISDEIESLRPGFILSLENSTLRFPSFWQSKKGKHIYKADSGRMAGAYIIDLEGARKILEDMKINKSATVIDWYHNVLTERKVVDMHWVHPPLVEQGSHNGYLNSTISSKPSSLSRRIAWLAQKYYNMTIGRLFNEQKIIEE